MARARNIATPAPDVEELEDLETELDEETEETEETGKHYDTRAIADELSTDPKTLRRFFRSDKCPIVTPVGQGGRYALDQDDVDKIKPLFKTWIKTKATAAAATETKKKAKVKELPAAVEEDIDDELDDEDLEI